MPDKKLISSDTKTTTKISTEADGTVVETITSVTTERYSDGTTGTRTETKTIRKTGGAAAGSGGRNSTGGGRNSTGGGRNSTGGGRNGIGGAKGGAVPNISHMLDPNLTPANSKSARVPNTTDDTFIRDCLETHNSLRARHGAQPLQLDPDLAKIAQAWAIELARRGQMAHNNTGFGENVYWNTDKPVGSRPADAWYSEIKDYNFNKLEGQKGTGHFTQLIWKGTRYVGIAMAQGKNGYYVVADYHPPGNIVGRYPENIQK